jgi:hypothetical protein
VTLRRGEVFASRFSLIEPLLLDRQDGLSKIALV